jgi:hypothetical protein
VMQAQYPLRKPYATRIRTLVACSACTNELYLIHAPYHPFRHWCLRCDKPTIHNRKASPPKQQVTDPATARERLRAYWREYNRQRRAARAV